ncbi:MAG TPA: DUF1569 domain-containing protein [Flavitalea sp.]|nr:DUF1569 domain-containing protein [Flavitalea sp.]
MKSLFNAADNQELIDRINLLTPAAKPVWGKMHVAQMLAHSQAPLKVAFGELKLKKGLFGMLFGRIAKRKMLAAPVFKKNLPTDKNFLVQHDVNFEEERKKLVALVQRFHQSGAKGIMMDDHPFFGKLTSEEWDILQYKHLDHHLRQFGV